MFPLAMAIRGGDFLAESVKHEVNVDEILIGNDEHEVSHHQIHTASFV